MAHAYARSGDPVAISEYLGQSDDFDSAVTTFSQAYAEQNHRDYNAFVAAVADGRIGAVDGI